MFSRTHWVVLPDKIVPGKPLSITFNFFNTTKDVLVQVDLLEYDHNSIVSIEHTFVNGKQNKPLFSALTKDNVLQQNKVFCLSCQRRDVSFKLNIYVTIVVLMYLLLSPLYQPFVFLCVCKSMYYTNSFIYSMFRFTQSRSNRCYIFQGVLKSTPLSNTCELKRLVL